MGLSPLEGIGMRLTSRQSAVSSRQWGVGSRQSCAARRLAVTLLLSALAAPAAAQEVHLLVVTGVSGDEEHAKHFQEWASTLVDAAKKREGLPDANIIYLAEKPEVD